MPRAAQRRPKEYKYSRYSYDHKLAVLQYRDTHTVQETIDRFFHGAGKQRRRATVVQLLLEWSQQRQRIESLAADAQTRDKYRARRKGLGTSLTHETESFLWSWVQNMRNDGVTVSREMLTLHALDVAPFFEGNKSTFKASTSWCTRFMDNNSLSDRAVTRQSQKTPEETAAAVASFSARVQGLMQLHNTDVVYNADQTAIQHDLISKRTLNNTGAKSVWVKCKGGGERTTAMVLGDSTGKKHAPFLVFKTPVVHDVDMFVENVALRHGFGVKLWPKMQLMMASGSTQIYGNPTAWWNGMLSIEFLRHHFGSRDDMTRRVLLVWDSFAGHFTAGVQYYADSINVELIKVPPSFTYVCQPADVAWMRPLKSRLRQRWIQFIRDSLCSFVPGETKMASLRPSRGDIVSWVEDAWADMPASHIVNGFVKCQLIPRENVATNSNLLVDMDAEMDDALYNTLVSLGLVEIIEPLTITSNE